MKSSQQLSKTLVLAHRGASGSEPENTLRAFETAYQMGADGLELDVFLTKDKQLVVTHNNNTALLTGKKHLIRKTDFKNLRKLDFGKKEKIPTLAEVFDQCLKKFSVINIEIKSTGLRTDGIEKRLAELIKTYKCSDQVIISSFNPLNLLRFKRLLPKVRLGYLLCQEQTLIARNWRMINLVKPYSLHLDQNLYRQKKFHSFFDFPRVYLWTVNTVEQMQFWLDKGVEGIITNYPDKLVKLNK